MINFGYNNLGGVLFPSYTNEPHSLFSGMDDLNLANESKTMEGMREMGILDEVMDELDYMGINTEFELNDLTHCRQEKDFLKDSLGNDSILASDCNDDLNDLLGRFW